jgi:hypothetical protein
MKIIVRGAMAIIVRIAEIKKKMDLQIVHLTNLKTFATLEAIIIGMAS